MRLQYDRDADALYIRVRDDAHVARTEQVDEGTLVDLDRLGRPVGIEVLRPARAWPLDDVLERYEVGDDQAEMLRQMWREGHRYPFEPEEEAVSGLGS